LSCPGLRSVPIVTNHSNLTASARIAAIIMAKL